MMPEFASLVDRHKLASLADKFHSAKKRAPTRSAPTTLDKHSLNVTKQFIAVG